MSEKDNFTLPDGRKLSDLKVTDLKKELEKYGKSRSGSKSELVNRLFEAIIATDEHSLAVEKEISDKRERRCQRTKEIIVEEQNNIVDSTTEEKANSSEINQSVDLVLNAPNDESLNPADDNVQEESIQVTVLKEDEYELNETNSISDEMGKNKDDGDDERMAVVCKAEMQDDQKEQEESDAAQSTEARIDQQNEDEIEKIEIDTNMELYDVDLDAQVELDEVIKKETTTSADNSRIAYNCRLSAGGPSAEQQQPTGSDHHKAAVPIEVAASSSTNESSGATVDHQSQPQQQRTIADDAEEGEVITVPITARLGKRKVAADGDDRESSPRKTKKKGSGLKEVKGSGYIVEDPIKVQIAQRSRHNISDVLRVDNLVRPFTQAQLYDMLFAKGKVVDVWLNRIKSIAYVKFDSESTAISARDALDGSRWPSINPKLLLCDFSTQREMDWMKEKGDSGVNPPSHLSITGIGDESKDATVLDDWRAMAERDRARDERVHVREDRVQQKSSIMDRVDDANRRRPRENHQDVRSKPGHSPDKRRRRDSPKEKPRERDRDRDRDREKEKELEKSKEKPPTAAKLLEDLFKKTVAQPAIYWLPASKEKRDEQPQPLSNVGTASSSKKPLHNRRSPLEKFEWRNVSDSV